MHKMIAKRWRGNALRAVLAVVALICCFVTATVGYAETTPGGAGRSPGVRPDDVPSNSLPYTYVAGPTLTSVTPAFGLFTGGYTVTLTGTGFTGATAVSFGGTPATSFTVNSATQITATVPPGTGVVQVTVTTPNGTTNSVTFTYLAPPVITSIAPSIGTVNGGTTVIITGLNFTGATLVSFGANPATIFTVDSATQITAVTPMLACIAGADPCQVQVAVTTPAGTSNTVTYTYVPEPNIFSITPNSGPITGGNTVIIEGFWFTGVSAVSFGGTPATSFTVDSQSQITAVVPAHALGAVNVTLTGPGGVSPSSVYTYVAAPTITGLSPTSGPEAGGVNVTITGTNLLTVTAVSFGATPATSFVVNSGTQITATAPAGTGAVQVTVTGPGGVSGGQTYTYVPAPTITSVTPDHGDPAGGNTVIILGTNFTGATGVAFGATPAAFVVISNTQISVTAPAGTGVVSVSVTTPGGTATAPGAYEYDELKLPLTPMDWESDTVYGVLDAPLAAAPTLTNLAPASGPEAGGNTVIITGSELTGVTSVMFGAVPAASFTVNSDTQITAVAPPGTGTVPVVVRNSNSLAFSVANVAAAEGNSGTSTLTFTVSLSNASGQAATVQYATNNGTAVSGEACGVAGVDFQAASGTLTFNPGETSKTVSVTVCGDTTAEADETFTLNLSNATGGATIGTATATGTVGDDDTPQTVRVDQPTITYNPDGTATATFPITTGNSGGGATGASARASAQVGAQTFLTITVSYSTADGVGKAGVDYVPTSGTLTFAPGENSKTVDVTILPAGLAAGSNSFSLILTSPSNATIPPGGEKAQAVVGDTTPPVAITTDDDDKPRKETEEQRQQRQRTNRSNRDDEYTEGNVVEVHQDENPPYVVIVNRDGNVKVMLQCGSDCPSIKVGQYVEVDGVKENEGLFYAESVHISKR